MRGEFRVWEIVQDEFLSGLELLGIDLDEDDEFARKDFAVIAQLAEECPVGIQSVGSCTKSELGFVAYLRL